MKLGPKYKIARRLGAHMFPKTQTEKFSLSESRRGQKERKHGRSISDFNMQLMEKQRVRLSYGIGERQFRRYIRESSEQKKVNPSEALFVELESRLDNVLYAIGIAKTRRAARQLVSHGHITVNGRRTKVPSYRIHTNDVIALRDGSKNKGPFQQLEEKVAGQQVPPWIEWNPARREAKIIGEPVHDVGRFPFNLVAVIEFYSR